MSSTAIVAVLSAAVVAVSANDKNIAEIVAGDPQFSTLLEAVKIAGLADTLAGAGPFTVFAPNNDAFAKIATDDLDALLSKPEALEAVLLRHAVNKTILGKDIPQGSNRIKTIEGEEIEVFNDCGEITITSCEGKAKVIKTDIMASNGVIHIVDTVF